jgi:hypothetical protein
MPRERRVQNGCVHSDWLPPGAAPPPAPLALPAFLEVLSNHLRSAAFDLRSHHVAEVGFRLHPALEAVDELAALDLAVLGGDVWETRGTAAEPTYDNWDVNRAPQEVWVAYVRRAAARARDRIQFYDSLQPDGTALIVLVPSTERRYNELMAMHGQLKRPVRGDG